MGGKRKDLTGQKFGRLTVIEFSHCDGKHSFWKCMCECGNITIVRRNSLIKGATKSCGCYKKEFNVQQWENEDFRKMQSEKMTKQNEDRWSSHENREKASKITKERWEQEGYKEKISSTMKENWKDREDDRQRYKEKWMGKENPNYNENLTDEDRQNRRNAVMEKEWRNKVFRREDYICEKCGRRGCKLNAHHKNAFHWNIKDRYNIDNGACLCSDCHKKFHKKYGTKYNTEEQYIAFLIEDFI